MMFPDQSPQPSHSPVLDGLLQIGLSGKDIAHLSEVSAPTISKWRGGKARPPASSVVFLTLVLAHKIEEIEELGWHIDDDRSANLDDWALDLADQVEGARRCLKSQERFNSAISPDAVYAGAKRYRDWLNGVGAFAAGSSTAMSSTGPIGMPA